MSTKTILLGTVAFLTLATVYLTHSSYPYPSQTMQSIPTVTPTVSLSTISSHPPQLRITLHNPSPNPLTFIRYNSPLDPDILTLGLVRITSLDGEDVSIVAVHLNRMWPPDEADIVELGPGNEERQVVGLAEPGVELEAGRKYLVWVEGSWMGLWGKGKAEVAEEEVESAGVVGGKTRWRSEEVVLRI
ncbi:hypothetical protein P152DRAFT_446681 [Eremomyces bilateralis CBS 781.70]|uniref:Uncharacterized protein n=1 Tax=Eremomyces bilateralis CBS 781.70 TaxID=1392243 RepID=A0A6G1GCJ0_9PEZI|nr:uncharacterized protein P152DRAFT_446681 [Eremomyces bilateralis CBS 781.70]KAF1815636.1 hypothetical protein P152DRAFT_446681 [Eremomyces bilateralis CBS 781.70]